MFLVDARKKQIPIEIMVKTSRIKVNTPEKRESYNLGDAMADRWFSFLKSLPGFVSFPLRSYLGELANGKETGCDMNRLIRCVIIWYLL